MIRGLVVVGNPDTLLHSQDWRAWLNWIEQKGSIIRAKDLHRHLAKVHHKRIEQEKHKVESGSHLFGQRPIIKPP